MTPTSKRYKFCNNCEQSKSVEDFYRRSNGYLSAWCKPCTTAANNASRAEKRREAREARKLLPAETEKVCKACGEAHPLSDFYLRKKGGTARVTICRACHAEQRREYYYRPEVRTRIAKQAKDRSELRRSQIRAKNLARYGLGAVEYDSMYDSQDGCCAICKKPGNRLGMGDPRNTVLCVDHDHVDGAVRGLLCHRCNRAVGLLGDNATTLKSAIFYLEKER